MIHVTPVCTRFRYHPLWFPRFPHGILFKRLPGWIGFTGVAMQVRLAWFEEERDNK